MSSVGVTSCTDDRLDPVANDHTLARLIPGARLVLYPDAGHGFLFQEGTPFDSLIEKSLPGAQARSGAAPCRDESRDRASANRSPESCIDVLVFTLKGLTLAQ